MKSNRGEVILACTIFIAGAMLISAFIVAYHPRVYISKKPAQKGPQTPVADYMTKVERSR